MISFLRMISALVTSEPFFVPAAVPPPHYIITHSVGVDRVCKGGNQCEDKTLGQPGQLEAYLPVCVIIWGGGIVL